jgi:hypothetical protein
MGRGAVKHDGHDNAGISRHELVKRAGIGFGHLAVSFGGSAVIGELTDLRWIAIRGGSHPFPF